ncbi:MAG TPA: hypothetical protein VJ719_06400 [Chthoniobacterales bacterium]|nr:hypothetical protein [Chthoniobacterales bacterium]
MLKAIRPLVQRSYFRFGVTGILSLSSLALVLVALGKSEPPLKATRWPASVSNVQTATSGTQMSLGAWSIIPTPPNTLGRQIKSLNCASAADCWAVGYTLQGVDQGFILHWNGSSWSDVVSPQFNVEAHLESVTCVSTSDCWAVGFTRGLTFPQPKNTLIEHWDGNSWTVVASPNPSNGTNFLFGVTCVSSNDCWAAGLYGGGVLTEHWDGQAWQHVAAANPGTSVVAVVAITCVSGADCWLAGYYYPNENTADVQTLVEHWNGTSWAIVPSPNLGPTNSQFSAISCVSSSQCWAVGYGTTNTNPNNRTLIERWDGNAWTLVPSPNEGETAPNILSSVSCPSASNCWAVGSINFSAPNGTPLVQHWNGSAWSIVSSPALNSTHYGLYAVDCPSDATCRAAGWFNDGSAALQTLAEHFTATPPQIMSASRAASSFSLTGQTAPSLQLQVEASAMVTNGFEGVDSVSSDASGHFEFQDSNPGPRKFYRVVIP